MEVCYSILSGGLWLCESLEYLRQYVKVFRNEVKASLPPNEETPLHTIVGSRGYHTGRWPKKALRCKVCNTVAILGSGLGKNY